MLLLSYSRLQFVSKMFCGLNNISSSNLTIYVLLAKINKVIMLCFRQLIKLFVYNVSIHFVNMSSFIVIAKCKNHYNHV